MKKSILAFAAAFVAVVGMAPAAYANAEYNFDVDFMSGGASEAIYATITVSGDQVIGITGSLDGYGFTGSESIVSLVQSTDFPDLQTQVNTDGHGANLTFDNVFSASGLDDNGIVFKLADGHYAGLWANSPGNYELFVGYMENGQFDGTAVGDFQVPEPSTLAMMLTGFLALGGMLLLRRRAKTQSFAAI